MLGFCHESCKFKSSMDGVMNKELVAYVVLEFVVKVDHEAKGPVPLPILKCRDAHTD